LCFFAALKNCYKKQPHLNQAPPNAPPRSPRPPPPPPVTPAKVDVWPPPLRGPIETTAKSAGPSKPRIAAPPPKSLNSRVPAPIAHQERKKNFPKRVQKQKIIIRNSPPPSAVFPEMSFHKTVVPPLNPPRRPPTGPKLPWGARVVGAPPPHGLGLLKKHPWKNGPFPAHPSAKPLVPP